MPGPCADRSQGDSRIVMYSTRDGGLSAEPLSLDHKPDRRSELKRILITGGSVQSIMYDDGIEGPPRVWLNGTDGPGLAMAR